MGARAGGGGGAGLGRGAMSGLTKGAKAFVKQALKEGSSKAQALKIAKNYNDWFEPNGDIALPF